MSAFGVYAVMELGYAPPPSPPSPPPPYIAPSPPAPPPPSPPPWPAVEQGSTDFVFAMGFGFSLETLNGQQATDTGARRKLLRDAAGPVFGFQTRLLDALHDSAHETRRRKLLQISGDPAFAFLDALHAAMVQKTGLDPDYVRLGAVLPVLDEDGNPTGSVSVEFSLVFKAGHTSDLVALQNDIVALKSGDTDFAKSIKASLESAGFDSAIIDASMEATAMPVFTVLLPPPPMPPSPPPPLEELLTAPPPPAPPPRPVFKIVASPPPPAPPNAPPPSPPPFDAFAPNPPPPSPPSPPEVTPPVIVLALDDNCVQTTSTEVTCTLTQTFLETEYTDPGFSASDNLEGSYKLSQVEVNGAATNDNNLFVIDLSTRRVEVPWVITYDVSDQAGNAATQMVRFIYVIPPCEPLPSCPKRKMCNGQDGTKPLSTPSRVVCETCAEGSNPICLEVQEVQEVPDLRPPLVTSKKSIRMADGADPMYSYRAQDEDTRKDIIVAYVEQGDIFNDPGAVATETITSTDQKTMIAEVTTSDITGELVTRVIGKKDTTRLQPGNFFKYEYEVSTLEGDTEKLVIAERTVIVLNPCAITTTVFGDIVGTKNVPQYDSGDGEMMDERLCEDKDHFDKYGEEIFLSDGQCSINGKCLNILLVEEVEEVVYRNDPPELFLFGASVVVLTAGQPWLICLPGTPAADVCDRGIDQAISFDPVAVPEAEYDEAFPKRSVITNKQIRVCASEDGLTGGAVFSESHYSIPGGRDLSEVCGFTTRVAGTFTIDYSFVDDAGQLARVTRQIIVRPDCGKERLCDNKKVNEETGLEEFVCSKGDFCEGDLIEDEAETVDYAPVIELAVVPGVVEKTVNIRKFQKYEPCKVDPNTGIMQQPENTFFGDGLCDPGFKAYDILEERTKTGDVKIRKKPLTAEVLSCPPVECESLESCDAHKYTKKGLKGCLDTTVEGTSRIQFTVRDDAYPIPHVTKVYREVTVIGPCPVGYDYCPDAPGDQDCKPTQVCENAEKLVADVEVYDTDPPEFTRFLPSGPILLEYGVDYVSGGNTPFKPCTSATKLAAAEAQFAAGTATADQYQCAMKAYDKFDREDVTQYITITQRITGSEKFFDVNQHGTGITLPAQYTYDYTVSDLKGNVATETIFINVAIKKSVLYAGLEIPKSAFDAADFQETFKEKEEVRIREEGFVDAPIAHNQIFRGAEDLEILNESDDGTTTTFDYRITYFELPTEYTADPSSRRRRLLETPRRSLLSFDASLSNATGTDVTTNTTSSSSTDSADVDENAAVVASIEGEIAVIAAKLDTAITGLQETIDDLGNAGGNPAAFKQRIGDYWGSLLAVGDAALQDLRDQAEETLRVLDDTISVQQQVLESVAELEIMLKKQADELKATIDALGEGSGDSLGGGCEHRTGLGTAEIFFNATKYSLLGSPPPSPAPPPSPPAPPPNPPPPTPPPPEAPAAGTGRRRLHEVTPEEARINEAAARFLAEGFDADPSLDAEAEDSSAGARRRLLQSSSSSSSLSSGGGWTGAASAVTDWKGYDVYQGGSSAQYAAPPSYLGRRYVSGANRLVGGLLIHQVRNELVTCPTKKFKDIAAACRSSEPSREPFGVDPVFRRPEAGEGSPDSLYNVDLEDFVSDYYNTSFAAGSLRTTGQDGVGTPYGFFHRNVPGYEKGFPVYLDIAATRSNLGNLLQYLKEGLYFDFLTRSVTAQAVTYNSNLGQLANVLVTFNFTETGSVEVSHRITNINVRWYTEFFDANGDGVNDGTAQLILEVMLLAMFAYAASLELAEILGAIWDEQSVYTGLRLHFSSFWNILDAANIGLQLLSVSVWMGYQGRRRAALRPMLQYDVYDNPAQPMANFLMPFKSAAANAEVDALGGLPDALAQDVEHRWQLPTDESGMKALGESMMVIQELADLLTFYFAISGISLLLMVFRSLKFVDFQRHLDLTVRTLSRSALDLFHFLVILWITLGLSTMVGHLMLGSTEQALSTLDKGFNFHFELMLGSSIEILAGLFTNKSIVRSDVEYFALVVYSFGVPVFILFVLLNLVLGILGDAYAEEKENLGELNEPTLMQDFSMAMSYRYGRLMGVHPSFDQMIQTLKAVRKPTTSKAVEVLASALGDDAHAPKGGDDDAKKKRASLGGKGKEPVTAAGSLVKNTPEASARARERWALVRAKAVKSNIVLKAMGVNMNELRKQDPAQQLAMAREKGFDAFVDVLTTTQDVDSDSDSSVDEEVKARRHKQNVLRGTAKPSAWSAIKEHSVAPKVSKPGSQWQTLMDDTWSEFMTTIKARQESKSEAKMFRIKDALYTEEEVTEWLLDADLEARRNGYFGMPPPSKRVIKRIVRSIVDSKVQQFDAADSDEEEEQDEQDEIVEAARDIKAAAVGKMQRFVRREMGWQNQTIAWQKSVTEAVARMEEELVMTHQVMTDLAKRGGGDAGAASDPAVRERMWATMQAKQALREALQNTPSAGRGGAALDADAADPELDDADDAAAAAPDVARGSLRDRWKAASSGGDSRSSSGGLADVARSAISGGSSSGGGAGGSVSGEADGSGAGKPGAKSNKPAAAAAGERTTTTSSMRRHRAGKKEKAAKAARLKSYNE